MPDRLKGFIYLLVTATGWALNWPAMKVLLREWPPLFSRGVAGIAAAVLLGLIAKLAGENPRVPAALVPRLVLASAINVFAWMGFSTLSMKWLSVGEGALLVYTMPIWAMLLAWPIAKRKPSIAGFARSRSVSRASSCCFPRTGSPSMAASSQASRSRSRRRCCSRSAR